MDNITDNLWEQVAAWQHHDEEQNLFIIQQHEIQTSTEFEAAARFQAEVKRRQADDE